MEPARDPASPANGTPRPYRLPVPLRDALATVFDVTPSAIDAVRIVERSRFARLHGRRVAATTRKHTVYVAGSGRRFAADPELVLHEYFHVLRQWNSGTLTTWRYVRESLRHGYRDNRFEVEARRFTRTHLIAFAAALRTDVATA